MTTICPQKNPNFFTCEICDYSTSNKKDFNRHLETVKHFSNNSSTKINGFIPKNVLRPFQCLNCEKNYKDRTGLWRHNKKCKTNNIVLTDLEVNDVKKEDDNEDELHMMRQMMVEMMKQNHELQNKMMEMCALTGMQHSNNTNTNANNASASYNTNSLNKTFNLQFFLNETCKDAMNLTDFVNSIQLQLSDLENVGEKGYVKGISDIIIKNLNQLDITQRPVHCNDLKREIMYVKEENQWFNDTKNETSLENQKLKKAIKTVTNKNIGLISEWKKKYPDCIYADSRKSDQYNHIMYESMDMNDNNYNKIVKNIAKTVMIDKE
jgi:hypothetical protein